MTAEGLSGLEGWTVVQPNGHPATTYTLEGLADVIFIAARTIEEVGAASTPDSPVARSLRSLREVGTAMRAAHHALTQIDADRQPLQPEEGQSEEKGSPEHSTPGVTVHARAETIRYERGETIVVEEGMLRVLDDDDEVIAAFARGVWSQAERNSRD